MLRSILNKIRFLFIVIITAFFASCDTMPDAQPDVPDINPSSIDISWELLSNFEPGNQFSAALTFTNSGTDALQGDGWALYLNSIRALDSGSFLPYLSVIHINGDFYKLEPTGEFHSIEPGESRTFEYKASYFAIKESDAPQGFYFVFDDGRIEQVESIAIMPFTEPEQVHRSQDDHTEVPTPQTVFERNRHLSKLNPAEITPITPSPSHIERNTGEFLLDGSVEIWYDDLFKNEAHQLDDFLHGEGFESNFIPDEESGNDRMVSLQINEDIENREGYRLEINSGRINIAASAPAGMFYGVQSLRGMMENYRDTGAIPAYTIEDAPEFLYRGMHLDVSRNFQTIDDVKKLLDIMGMYKLNKFHFHLTDDEGWRLAIESLPELVEVGARRGHTITESDFLIPSYGSGPDPTPGNSFGSGWYTRDEYIDLLRFASERHIEVIPEIDVPGHARAAIKAMQARTNRLMREGDLEAADEYRLDDPEDESQYRSIQNFNDNVINVCIESTYNFLALVFDEVIEMHREAGAPLSTIHIGGDEVPEGVWQDSPACRAYMDEHEIDDTQELQVHFFGLMINMLEERGLKMAGWEEVAFMGEPHGAEKTPNTEFAGSAIPHVWSNIWGAGTEDYAYVLANMGYEIVMSHASSFYFDMAYNKDYREPGFYWANLFDTKEPFSFIPFDLYKNAVTDSYGDSIPAGQFSDAERLTEEGRGNILGLQGQLWTETVNEEGRMDYMIYPRLFALAERAWAGNPGWSRMDDRQQMWNERDIAWNEFANRIGRYELARLDKNHPGINYRIPPPGAVIEDGMLIANTIYPGLQIRYTLDGSEPSLDSPVYDEPVQTGDAEEIKLSAFNEVGRSGRVSLLRADIE